MAAVCARPHPEDVSEACSATLLVPRSCSASTGEIAVLNDYACANNGGLMSIAQEATVSLRSTYEALLCAAKLSARREPIA
jgi:hypothetical protein